MLQLTHNLTYTNLDEVEKLMDAPDQRAAFNTVRRSFRRIQAIKYTGIAATLSGIGTLILPTIAKGLSHAMSENSERSAYIAGPIVLFFGLCTVCCCWSPRVRVTVDQTMYLPNLDI